MPRAKRRKYTDEEDNAIIEYVASVSKNEFTVSGNKLWQEMEKKKIIDRSWSSMRERYLSHLINKKGIKKSNVENCSLKHTNTGCNERATFQSSSSVITRKRNRTSLDLISSNNERVNQRKNFFNKTDTRKQVGKHLLLIESDEEDENIKDSTSCNTADSIVISSDDDIIESSLPKKEISTNVKTHRRNKSCNNYCERDKSSNESSDDSMSILNNCIENIARPVVQNERYDSCQENGKMNVDDMNHTSDNYPTDTPVAGNNRKHSCQENDNVNDRDVENDRDIIKIKEEGCCEAIKRTRGGDNVNDIDIADDDNHRQDHCKEDKRINDDDRDCNCKSEASVILNDVKLDQNGDDNDDQMNNMDSDDESFSDEHLVSYGRTMAQLIDRDSTSENNNDEQNKKNSFFPDINEADLDDFDRELIRYLARQRDNNNEQDVVFSDTPESDPSGNENGNERLKGLCRNDIVTCIQRFSKYRAIAIENVNILSVKFMATRAEIFDILFHTCGRLDSATEYLRTGYSDNYWSSEDDEILTSKDERALNDLIMSRGAEHVAKRGLFLYHVSLFPTITTDN